jgi:hypothetical protein
MKGLLVDEAPVGEGTPVMKGLLVDEAGDE